MSGVNAASTIAVAAGRRPDVAGAAEQGRALPHPDDAEARGRRGGDVAVVGHTQPDPAGIHVDDQVDAGHLPRMAQRVGHRLLGEAEDGRRDRRRDAAVVAFDRHGDHHAAWPCTGELRDVAEAVQQNVKDKIQAMTGTAVTRVNVVIADVEIKEETDIEEQIDGDITEE